MIEGASVTPRGRGRLAPSPTGFLHLGNAWAFFLAWLAVRLRGGELILRMEDLDPARSRAEYAGAILHDLAWMGLDWDEGPRPDGGETGPHGPYRQSDRGVLYQRALDCLARRGLIYPCYCTRRELRDLASAPHTPGGASHHPYSHLAHWVGDAGAVYPGVCRDLSPEQRARRERAGRKPAWRLACPSYPGGGGPFAFTDLALGPQRLDADRCGGDFALRRSDGVWAYQLAVVTDDALMAVDQVVRGQDILASTPRQILLFNLLGYSAPRYAHIPLLHDERGDRLAKRHNSLSLRALRDAGIRPQAITGWLASLAGLAETGAMLSPQEALIALRTRHTSFPWKQLPQEAIIVPDRLPF